MICVNQKRLAPEIWPPMLATVEPWQRIARPVILWKVELVVCGQEIPIVIDVCGGPAMWRNCSVWVATRSQIAVVFENFLFIKSSCSLNIFGNEMTSHCNVLGSKFREIPNGYG
jgi:hypothetical protein